MNVKELDEILARTLADGKLSRAERQVLSELLAEHDPDGRLRDLYRSRAFEAARGALEHPRQREVLGWLEDVVRVLTPEANPSGRPHVEAHFSPGTACVGRITSLLDGSRQSAEICVFTLTDDRIARSVRAAHARGVKVRIVTDNEKAFDLGSDVEDLARAGVPVAVDTSPYHMHHKFAIFDGRLLLTGSYNWTRGAAAENEENLVVLDDPRLLAAFSQQFDELWARFKTGG
jgi:mitochondrial cardiolipin hydrolase